MTMQHSWRKVSSKGYRATQHPCVTLSNLAAPRLTLHYPAVDQYHLPLQFPAVSIPVLLFCIPIHCSISELLDLHLLICVIVTLSGSTFYMQTNTHLTFYLDSTTFSICHMTLQLFYDSFANSHLISYSCSVQWICRLARQFGFTYAA